MKFYTRRADYSLKNFNLVLIAVKALWNSLGKAIYTYIKSYLK